MRVAVATVQFSRVVREGVTHPHTGIRPTAVPWVPGRRRARGLSKLNSMRGLELGEMPRVTEATRPPADTGRRLARPGSVDVLGRAVGRPLLSDRSRPLGGAGAGQVAGGGGPPNVVTSG